MIDGQPLGASAPTDGALAAWAALSASRASVYAWFSSAFAAELTGESIEAYRRGDADALFGALQETGFAAEVKRLRAALEAWAAMPYLKQELAADFARLFLIDARDAAMPYASAYLDPKGQLYGEPHQKMRTSLQNSGLRVHTGFKEPSDHLAVVLAYVETSIRRAADVSASDRASAAADQASFLKSALLSWLPQFAQRCQGLRKDTASDFYPALAGLLLAFVSEDAAWLEAASEQP